MAELLSCQNLDDIERRTKSYVESGIPVIWILLIKSKFLENARRLDEEADGDYFIEMYPARTWQRWIHGYNMACIWFYDPTDKRLWRTCTWRTRDSTG